MVKENVYAEVSAVLEKMRKEDIDKIPHGLLETIENNKNAEHNFSIDPSISLEEQNLSKESKAMLALINYKYFSDEAQKEELKKIYEENDRKAEQELRDKYHTDDIFGNKEKAEKAEEVPEDIAEKHVEETQETALVEVKETVFTKIVNFFKELFHIG